MVIDIDSFLDKFVEKKNNNKHKVSLDFQKDVEDRLLDVQSRVKDRDVSVLKKIYDEVKSFDEDLPSKFFGIEQKGGVVLSELGNTYSQEFLKKNKSLAGFLSKKINDNMFKVEEMIKVGDFANVLKIFRQIVVDFDSYPKVFFKQRSVLGNKIRLAEVKVFSLFERYKKSKILSVKKELNLKVLEARKVFAASSLAEVDKFVLSLQVFIASIPEVLISSLVQQKVVSLKLLNKAELFFIKKAEEDFEYKNGVINSLFEKFHVAYVEKNLSEVLLVYNEILILFKQLPDLFLEKKVALFVKINDLFDRVNKIVLSNNVQMFMGTYEYSRKIEAIREYLRSVKLNCVYSVSALDKLKEQVLSLPKRFAFERDDFLEEIDELLSSLQKRISTDLDDDLNLKSPVVAVAGIADNLKSEEFFVNKVSKANKDCLVSNLNGRDGQNKTTLQEINSLYERLKISDNVVERNKIREKIIFYLRILPVKKEVKVSVLKKIKKVMESS